MDQKKPRNKFIVGKVVKVSSAKTIQVMVVDRTKHPKYLKHLNKNKYFRVHDENGNAKVGDRVAFFETRKISKTKYHVLAKVIETGINYDTDADKA